MAKKKPLNARQKGTPRYSQHYVRDYRLRAHLTQEQLAVMADTTHASIQRIETRKQALTQPMLDRLALALGTSRGNLLDRPPPKEAE